MKPPKLSYKLALLVFALFFKNFIFSQNATPEKFYRIEANISEQQIKDLKKNGFEADHFYYKDNLLTAEISKSDLELLKANNVDLKIKIRNLEKRIPRVNKRLNRKSLRKSSKKNFSDAVNTPENFSLGSMGGFFTLAEAIDIIDQMQEKFPNLITVKKSIGSTVQNRPTYMVKISDNPNLEEADEEEVLYTAIHHAREPIGLSQMIFYMWHLLENYDTDAEIKTLVDNTAMYFVPVVNPDGYVFNQTTNPNGGGFWRKNRKNNGNGTFGVDLNRNYGYLWEPNNPLNTSSQAYRGTSGFSEPETQNIRDFINTRKFSVALNYHSFSNLLIKPWGYTGRVLTADNDLYTAIGEYMTEENGYLPGTPFETLGVEDFGSSDDWMYGEQTDKPKILAMTPEVGSRTDGFWPPSSRIIPLCKESYYFNIKLARIAALYAKLEVEDASKTTSTPNGSINFSVERLSLKDTDWTVSLTSNSPYIKTINAPVNISGLKIFDKSSNTIGYELTSNTPRNQTIALSLKVSNGIWDYTENFDLTYNGLGTSIICNAPDAFKVTTVSNSTATLEWAATTDSDYKLRYRITGTPTWTEINTISTNSYTINGLEASTEYEVQIANNCSDFSSELIFNTVASTTLNIADFEDDNLTTSRFFPNPVKKTLFIELDSEEVTPNYTIYDAKSKQVQSGALKSNGTIDVSKLAPELYFLIIDTKINSTKIKFLKN